VTLDLLCTQLNLTPSPVRTGPGAPSTAYTPAQGAEKITPHSLRDTYASHLLSAGILLAYISTALGHADVAITARHYARWCGGDEYRAPIALAQGEVPADLLARLAESHQSPTRVPPPQPRSERETPRESA